MFVGTAARIAALDSIKADMKKLGDPRGVPPAEISAIVDRSPVITWLIHGVRYSDQMFRMLARSAGETYRIRRLDHGVVQLERIPEPVIDSVRVSQWN